MYEDTCIACCCEDMDLYASIVLPNGWRTRDAVRLPGGVGIGDARASKRVEIGDARTSTQVEIGDARASRRPGNLVCSLASREVRVYEMLGLL